MKIKLSQRNRAVSHDDTLHFCFDDSKRSIFVFKNKAFNVVNMVYVPRAPVGSNGAVEHDAVVRSAVQPVTSTREPPPASVAPITTS